MRRLYPVMLFGMLCACSPQHLVINAVADALSGSGPGWGADDDPELVAAATPFALKTIESLLQTEPDNPKLALAACSGFTQYAYAFVLEPAQEDAALRAEALKATQKRSARLLARANRYCWQGLDSLHPGLSAGFKASGAKALEQLTADDVPLVYWSAASLALAISIQKDQPEMLAELPAVGLLADRALALSEGWDHGTLHELEEAYEASRPAAMGGSVDKAKRERDTALAEDQHQKLGPLVTWAEDVDVAAQNKDEFKGLLDKVLAFDIESAPDYRLTNTLAQRRAAWLEAHQDDLFL